MANVLDVRAWVYCNLGTVISGNIQESSIIGAGLINVSGTLQLSGVYKIRRGDPVELAYYKNGRVARLGRKLRVISAYANPVTRTTEVAVGCYLTYQAESSPPPQVLSSAEDTNTPDVDGIAALLLIKPISAKYVAERCCAALGLSHDTIPLTNQFYRDRFEISGPYLNVLSDLLISENYVGYVDSNETLKFINMANLSGTGPVLNESKVIDITPINTGDQDADVVYSIVQRKTIKLDDSLDAGGSGDAEDVEEILERNNIPVNEETLAQAEGGGTTTRIYGYASGYWLSGYSTALPEVALFRHQPKKPAGSTQQPPAIEVRVTYNPSSSWTAKYNNSGQIQYRFERKGGVWGDTRKEVYYDYSDTNGVETEIVTSYVYAPREEIVLACGFPSDALPNLPANISAIAANIVSPGSGDTFGTSILKEKTVTVTRATDTSVITTEYKTVPMIYTADGASLIQLLIRSFIEGRTAVLATQMTGIVDIADNLISLPGVVTFAQKAPSTRISQTVSISDLSGPSSEPEGKFPYDPTKLDEEDQNSLLAQELENDQTGEASTELPGGSFAGSLDAADDSKAGYIANVVEVPEIIYSKNTPGGIVLEFTPPYLSDDRLVASGGKYSVTPSDAATKARLFANTQNRLRFGRKNGQSVVFPVEYLPTRPFGPMYLDFNNVVGQYRMDSTNIVFDGTGILVSTDAIFWGGVGQ